MNTRQIVCTAARIDRLWAGIPGVEVSPGGRIFVTWFSGGESEPSPENTVYLSRSDDDGASFDAPVVILSPRDGARAYDPTLWLDPDRRLWLICNRGNREKAEHGVYARICADPDAEEPLWGDEFRVGFDAPFSFRLNKPTTLSTGEWIMPVTHAAARTPDWFAGAAQLQGVAISRDHGTTWSLHGSVKAPHWALENMIVERRDATLVMYIRTGSGVIWHSTSADRGFSWSPGEPTTIANPGSRFFVRRLADRRWLLINSPDPKNRTGIVASLSTDDGATWEGRLVLDDRDAVSYPDAAITADGTVYAVYDRDRKGAGEILLSRFTVEEIALGDSAIDR